MVFSKKNSLIGQTAKICFFFRLFWGHFEALFEHETAFDFQKIYYFRVCWLLTVFISLNYEVFQNFGKKWVNNVETFETFGLFGYSGVILTLCSNMNLQLILKEFTRFIACLLLSVLILVKYKIYETFNKIRFSGKF